MKYSQFDYLKVKRDMYFETEGVCGLKHISSNAKKYKEIRGIKENIFVSLYNHRIQ